MTQMPSCEALAPSLGWPAVGLLGDADRADALVAPLASLNYRLSLPLEISAGELVNVPLVVGPRAPSPAVLHPWLEHLGQMACYQEATLIDFQQVTAAIAALWGSLDDGVMGGVSASQVQWQAGLRFGGQVSTANGGGFASVRTRNIEPPLNLSQWQGTVLTAQGDGQRYKWILRDSPGWDSLAYCRSFDTQADLSTITRTPFLDMVATRRARTVPTASPLNPAQLYSMQFMLSKFEYDGDLNPAFQPGSFELVVQRLGVYRQAPRPVVLLPEGDDTLGTSLAAAGLVGAIPQGSGFVVIGADNTLPPEVTPAAVTAIFEALS
ncbi:MAG TPA: CIA30 family protein [Nodosilinea sp.]|nr:CIA30 family protein [Nodosilinea sp.]